MSNPTNIPGTPMDEAVLDSFLETKEKFHLQLQHVFQTTMKLTIPDQFDQLCQWRDYRQFATIDDLFDTFHKDPDKLDTKGPVTEYKWKGKMNHISPNVAQKVKSFVGWMKHEERPSELHDDFLFTLTRERPSHVDQGCIRLNWCTTIEMHIINTKNLHYLKYKAFCFDRNSHLFVPNSL